MNNKEKIKKISIQIFLLVFLLIIWELLSSLKIIDSFLFSSPSKIFKTLIIYISNGEIFKHILVSLFETICVLLIVCFLGVFLAMVLWYFPYVQKILSPFLIVFNALPKTALAPILIIWVGTDIDGIIVVAVSIFIVMTLITALTGFNQIEEDKIKMMLSFKASKTKILLKLVLPANLINIISLVKVNIGLTWVGVIVAEFLVSKAGIGYLILYGTQVFKMDIVMMGIFVLALLSFLMYEILNLIEINLIKRRS
jgi:NitT/TauT family transport system permease protein